MGKRGPKNKYSDAELKKRRKQSWKKYQNSAKGKATRKKWWTPGTKEYERCRKHIRKYQLKANFGLTLEDYDNMVAVQNGVCAICGKTNPSENRLAIDHDHKTGEIRGLLCQHCNGCLGWYEINKQKIKNYLKIGKDSY